MGIGGLDGRSADQLGKQSQLEIEPLVSTFTRELEKKLEDFFQIELHYATEVMHYLVHTALHANIFIDKILENTVYHCVSQAVFSRLEEQADKKRLYLSLNGSGQHLKGEFISRTKEYYA